MESIRAQGQILPATLHVPPGERPVVWFSARQHFEPTARKAIGFYDGRPQRLMTMQEMAELAGGLWRLGVAATELLAWRELKIAANISPGMVRGLEKAARDAGAQPELWYGALDAVAVDRCAVRRFDVESAKWRDA